MWFWQLIQRRRKSLNRGCLEVNEKVLTKYLVYCDKELASKKIGPIIRLLLATKAKRKGSLKIEIK